MKLLIKNGRIITEKDSFDADILCENGKITKIANNIVPDDDKLEVIDAKGRYILPGGIDPHVHMHLPTPAGYSSDDFYTGSKAALMGGTTTIIDFVTPHRGQSLTDALAQRKTEAKVSLVDYSFHMSPVEWRASTAKEIKAVISEGITSFKIYMAYKNSIGIDDDVILKVMQVAGKEGGIVTAHCELGDEIEKLRESFVAEGKTAPVFHPLSRPNKLEAEAVKVLIELGKKADCPVYIVHVSAGESLKYINKAHEKKQKVFAETCPQYLLLDDSKYKGDFRQSAPYVMSPPLRKKEDNQSLWEAIKTGLIQTIGTDHCPFDLNQKLLGENDFRKIPNGAGGVEHRLALLYTYGVTENNITLNQLVSLTSTQAAKIFGLSPRKGTIAVGSDADIVIWNPNAKNVISKHTHHQNCDINIFEGVETKGQAEYVILNGRILVKNNVLVQDNRGMFVKREARMDK